MLRSLGLVALLIGGAAEAATPPRSLLLITINTLRADHLGCNGATRVETPHLDGLAARGVNFTRVRSPVPLTLPAHASIFTGHYPPTHGVRDNGSYRLATEQETLAEVLVARGFDTAAFVGSFVLDRRFGLDQGFAHYDDRVWATVEEVESLGAERQGGEVVAVFANWMSSRSPAKPFFAWVHLFDPHAPYEPPEPYRSRYAEHPYGGEVAYTDHLVGEILEVLATHGGPSQTLVAVVGDHGEGLGEHGEATHSLLIYNSTLHVPMILLDPALQVGGSVIDDLVRTIDLAPTLLDLLEIRTELGSGISLRSRIENKSAEQEAPLSAYSESFYPELQLGWSALRGLESAGVRLIVAPEPELYDLSADPGELDNLASVDPSLYQRMKRQMRETLGQLEETDSVVRLEDDPEARARLRALGYLGGTGRQARERRGSPTDPKSKLDLWTQIQTAMAAFEAGDFRGAIRYLEPVLSEDPEILLVYEYLGAAWREISQDSKAEEIYRLALKRGLESAEIHRQLAMLCRERGDLSCTRRELEIALALDPRDVRSHFEIAQIHRRSSSYGEAIEHYRAALDLNPGYLWAWNGLALALAAQGGTVEARQAFERVIEIDPEGALGFFNLALHLDRSGLGREATVAYERFLELSSALGGLDPQRQQAQEALTRLSD